MLEPVEYTYLALFEILVVQVAQRRLDRYDLWHLIA